MNDPIPDVSGRFLGSDFLKSVNVAGHCSVDYAWMDEGNDDSLFDYFEGKPFPSHVYGCFRHTVTYAITIETLRN